MYFRLFLKSYFCQPFDILCIFMSPFHPPPPPVPAWQCFVLPPSAGVLPFCHGHLLPLLFARFSSSCSRPLANPTRSMLSALPLPAKNRPLSANADPTGSKKKHAPPCLLSHTLWYHWLTRRRKWRTKKKKKHRRLMKKKRKQMQKNPALPTQKAVVPAPL